MPNLVLNTTSNPGTATWTDISTLIPAGTQSLAQTLVVGNTTGGKDIIVSATDVIMGPSAAAGSGDPGVKLELAGGQSDGPGAAASVTLTVVTSPVTADISFVVFEEPLGVVPTTLNLLVPVAGPRTSGANDFNATGTTAAIAADIAAAINDPANDYAGNSLSATASGSQVIVQTSLIGTIGNSNQVQTLNGTITPVIANFAGGVDPLPAGPVVLSSPWGSLTTTTTGNARGLNSIDFQSFRTSNDQVASGFFSVLIGGTDNKVTGDIASVFASSGITNEAYATCFINAQTSSADANSSQSTILGGNGTVLVASPYATVLSGSNNTFTNSSLCMATSQNNTIIDSYSTIVLALESLANNTYGSTITNGAFNQVLSTGYNRAGGLSGVARNYGEDVYGVSGFGGVAGSAQRVEAIWAGTRSVAGAAVLKLGNTAASRYQIPTGFTLNFEWQIVGRCTSGAQSGAVCGFRVNGTATNNAGTVTIVASTVTTDSNTFVPAIAAPTVVVDATDAVAPSVTGIASNTIRYVVIMTGVLVGA